MRAIPLAALCCCLTAAPLLAQTPAPYVVGSVALESLRTTHVDFGGFETPGASGDVLAGSVRAGTSLGDRWGVELEFARGAEIDEQTVPSPRILPAAPLFANALTGYVVSADAQLVPFPITYSIRIRRSNPTLSALAWVRQPIGSRSDLVYLAGIAFTRSAQEIETSFTSPILRILPFPQTTRTVSYDAGPVVGVEGRIGLTDRLRLVPGLRLQKVGGATGPGWLLRAGAGLGWFF